MVRKTQRLKRNTKRKTRKVKRKTRKVKRKTRKVKRKNSRRVSIKSKRKMSGGSSPPIFPKIYTGFLSTRDNKTLNITIEQCQDFGGFMCPENNDGIQLFKIHIGSILPEPYIFRFNALKEVFRSLHPELLMKFKGSNTLSKEGLLSKIGRALETKYSTKTERPPEAFSKFLTDVAKASDMKDFIQKLKRANNITLRSLKSYKILEPNDKENLAKRDAATGRAIAKIYKFSELEQREEEIKYILTTSGIQYEDLRENENSLLEWAKQKNITLDVKVVRHAGPGISQQFLITINHDRLRKYVVTYNRLKNQIMLQFFCKSTNPYCKLNKQHWNIFENEILNSFPAIPPYQQGQKDERKELNLQNYIMSLLYLSLEKLEGFDIKKIYSELEKINSDIVKENSRKAEQRRKHREQEMLKHPFTKAGEKIGDNELG
jgi:hypothetical protein